MAGRLLAEVNAEAGRDVSGRPVTAVDKESLCPGFAVESSRRDNRDLENSTHRVPRPGIEDVPVDLAARSEGFF